MDDIGYHHYDKKLLYLPTSISFAILPHTPFSKQIARLAHQQKRDILLHLPMQAYTNNHLLGKGALTLKMKKKVYQKILQASLLAVPYAIGVNNHMGSQLTEQPDPMRWTMELLYKEGYFFVDSRTSQNSIAESSAMIAGLPGLKRDVFLDNVRTPEAMEKQFQTAIQHSQRAAHTIIIAHPYPETIQYLSQRLAQPSSHFQLTTLSQLIPEKQRITLQHKKAEYQQANLIAPDITKAQFQ